MTLIKAIWYSLVEVFGFFKLAPKLLSELFWFVMGVVSLVLSVVLFPVIVWRNYKELKPKKSKKVVRKFGVVKA
ncbi:hypothetical protein AVV48_gp10 [Acinetobacter phage phiAC-1]|uniref:hypothetical protein n=1 Tax=Acinetobacter phage phiAC-1 TaxID=1229760 RepID=UPI00028A5ED2|nr:hypothetical protein AVV48_gp10 [Acinetobacter phage phiAC-1]AFU62259.1 hypothetical protein phiAC-1_0010 [Acinetobacter phage phiAC-1]